MILNSALAITPTQTAAVQTLAQDAATKVAGQSLEPKPFKPAPPLHPTPQDIVDIKRFLQELRGPAPAKT